MSKFAIMIFLLACFASCVIADTSVNTNSIQTSNLTSSGNQLTIDAVTKFAGKSIKSVNNLFFSSKAFIVQENDGKDIVFQLDNSSGTRKNFLTLDNSALSTVLGTSLNMSYNQINNLADPTDPQDAATVEWVNQNDKDSNASTACNPGEVLTTEGCKSRYTASSDNDNSSTNEIQTLSEVLSEGSDAGLSRIENLGTPTSASDAATKSYVDTNQIDSNASTECNGENVFLAGDGGCQTDTDTNDGYVGNSGTHTAGGSINIPNGNLSLSGDFDIAGNSIHFTNTEEYTEVLDLSSGESPDRTVDGKVEIMRVGNCFDNNGGYGAWGGSAGGNIQFEISHMYPYGGSYLKFHYQGSRYPGKFSDQNHLVIAESSGSPPKVWLGDQVDTGVECHTGYDYKYQPIYMSLPRYHQYTARITHHSSKPYEPLDYKGNQQLYIIENYTDSITSNLPDNSVDMSGVDMNNNRIKNAEVEATEGLKIPVGQDAW